jgi:hypothetical protein
MKGSLSRRYIRQLTPHPRALISREEKALKTIQKNSIPVARSNVAIIV